MATTETTETTRSSENRPEVALPIPGADETHEESLQIMDKLKENAYWISLGASVVVLLLLVWSLVVARIFGSSGETLKTLGAQLDRDLTSIKAFTKDEYVPTELYAKHLKANRERVRLDHNDGAREYNDAGERFVETLVAAASAEQPPASSSGGRKDDGGAREVLLQLCAEVGDHFFDDNENRAFALVREGGVARTLPVRSRDYGLLLGRRFYRTTGSGLPSTAKTEAIATNHCLKKIT